MTIVSNDYGDVGYDHCDNYGDRDEYCVDDNNDDDYNDIYDDVDDGDMIMR